MTRDLSLDEHTRRQADANEPRWNGDGGFTPFCPCGWEGKPRAVHAAARAAQRAHRGRCDRPPVKCEAKLAHGPGHQSTTRCEVEGPHEVHRCTYGGGQVAEWRDGEYTGRLRAKGLDFDPESYPESLGMTGIFDEPPQEDS